MIMGRMELRGYHNRYYDTTLFSSLGTFQQKQIVTTQMLLNSKCLDKLVLHNECG